jgi:cold shock CspA family protein
MVFGSEIGKVLWFDRKKGYGFVKLVNPESENTGKDVFIHYSSINCNSDFKVLYPGETVSLDVEKNTDDSSDKEFITSNVSGVYGTSLIVDNEDFMFKVIQKKNRNRDPSESNTEEGSGESEDEGEVVS